MTDNSELKRLAENHLSLGQAYTVAKPSVLLALIAENERLSADCSSMRGSLKANAVSIKKLIKDGGRAARERDQLRAEVAGLKTGYEAYERVNAELKAECARSTEREILQLAEIEALRKALVGILDLYDTDEGCRSLPQYINGRAALGQGEKS